MRDIGWAIQMTRCAHLDKDGMERYAVNLVMPFSEDSLSGGPGPRVKGAEVVAAAGDLLKPWTWQNAQWQVFAGAAASAAWAAVGSPIGLEAGVDDDASFPCEAVFADLMAKGADCMTPFSLGDEALDLDGQGTRSLPHLLAPLTHWPAAVSNGKLRLAGFLAVDKAALDALAPNPGDVLQLACFPVFELAGKPGRREPGLPQEEGGMLKARYAADHLLVMATQPLQRKHESVTEAADPAPPAKTLPLAGARELAAQELAPLALLAKVATRLVEGAGKDDAALLRFADDALLRRAWRDALWAYFGTGWEAPYDLGGASYREHVLERLAPAIRALLPAAPWQASEAAFERTLTFLARPASQNWDTAQREPWVDLARRWTALAQPPADGQRGLAKTGERFLRDWLDLANALRVADSAGRFATPWFLDLMSGGRIDTLPPALDPQALRERAVGERVLHANALGVLSECGAMAAWLARPLADKAAATIASGLLAAGGPSGAPPMAQLLAGLEDRLLPLVDAYLAALEARASPATSRARDGGVPIVFEAAEPEPDFDESVRGYAIALGACLLRADGKSWAVDSKRSQWITDTAVLLQASRTWIDKSDGSWWMHETVGSTLQDGIRSTRLDYQGRPVAAMRADPHSGALLETDPGNGDPDGSDAIDFRWRAETARDTPLLGYGLAYKWAVATVDNAGGIIERPFRSDSQHAVLKDAAAALAEIPEPQWHYRSAVPPGAPMLVSDPIPTAAFEFSDDTRAHAHQAWRTRTAEREALPALRPGSAKVALLSHGQKLGDVPLYDPATQAYRKYSLTLAAPAAPADFVERWLNTDIVLLEHGLDALVSDPAFKAGAARLTEFRDAQLDAIARLGHRAAYHPAVSALGVAVWFDGLAEHALLHAFALVRTRSDGPGQPIRLGDERHVRLEVRSDENASISRASALTAGGKHTVDVVLAPGSFARIRFFSLVDDAHFAPLASGTEAGTGQRFYEEMERPEGDAVPAFPGFRSFGPAEHWFEAAPRWNGDSPEVNVKLVAPGMPLERGAPSLADDLMAFTCSCAVSPDWIRGMYVRRHDWHWTGYPVRLPHAGAGLEDWLTSFSGVESYREGGEVALDTGFVEDPVTKKTAWRYGSDASGKMVLQRKPLQAGTRPARYAAFTARPLLRLRSWLNPDCEKGPLNLEKQIYGDGALIRGRMPPLAGGERLPVPPLRWAVPLTATYAPAPGTKALGELQHVARGNMLVFDDALRRTDALSRLGGIGDTLEIDLVETRLATHREIGVNPIFHANPTSPLDKLDLVAQEAFGLTHDINSNALVVQTGVIVAPRNAEGRWIMAKVRARRLVLPETLANSALQVRQAPGVADSYALPLRVDGDTIVPLDFALDTPALAPGETSWPVPDLSIQLTRGDGGKTSLSTEFPSLAGTDRSKPLRFLCSWHKNRWDGATSTWRLQVLAQQRDPDTLAWRTLAKRSGFQNKESELATGQIDRAALSVSAKYQALLVPMSDYTEPKWLTFIGSFGIEQPGHPEHYRLSGDVNALRLSAADQDVPLPQLLARSESEPRFHVLLVYRPLADITRGGTPDGAGALLRAYRFDAGAANFKALPFADGRTPDTLEGCHAYLCTAQCVTALSSGQKSALEDIRTFEDVIALMFPPRSESGIDTEPGIAAECTIRLLPEFIGPIPLV